MEAKRDRERRGRGKRHPVSDSHRLARIRDREAARIFLSLQKRIKAQSTSEVKGAVKLCLGE